METKRDAHVTGEETKERNFMLAVRNYPPPEDLAPYIRRFYVFDAALSADFSIEDSLLAENAFVRILLRGDWAAEVAPAKWEKFDDAILFGSNSQPLPVRVKGPFMVAAFAIRPSAWRALFSQSAEQFVNTAAPLSAAWGDLANEMKSAVVANKDDDSAMVAAMVEAIRAQLKRIGRNRTDEKMTEFEAIARLDSTMKIEAVARQLGMSPRQMERRVMACYGLTPKAILRRSRFLDVAEAMRGFSTPGQRQLAELRYFDQSHLNREFHRFAGMTPGKFRKSITPLFTEGLRLRVLGKEIE